MGVQRHQEDQAERRACGSTGTRAERRVSCYYFYVHRPRVRARVHQDLHLLPVSGQGVAERARVGQTPSPPSPVAFTELANGFATCADPSACRRSVTGSARPTSRPSSTGGSPRSPPRSPPPTGPPATGGSCPCARSRCPAPWSSTIPAGPEGSSSPWWPTTSASVAPSEVAMVFARQVRTTTKASVPDPDLLAGHRGEDGLRLQALPGQAVPERRESASHRDRHQQAQRHRGPAPASSTCPSWSTRPARSTIVCL